MKPIYRHLYAAVILLIIAQFAAAQEPRPIYHVGELSPALQEDATRLDLRRIPILTNHDGHVPPGAKWTWDIPRVIAWIATYIPAEDYDGPVWVDPEGVRLDGRDLWQDAWGDGRDADPWAYDASLHGAMTLVDTFELLRPKAQLGWYHGYSPYRADPWRPTWQEFVDRLAPAQQLFKRFDAAFPGCYTPDRTVVPDAPFPPWTTLGKLKIVTAVHRPDVRVYPTYMHRRTHTAGPQAMRHRLWEPDEIRPHLEYVRDYYHVIVGDDIDGAVLWHGEQRRAELAFQRTSDGEWKYTGGVWEYARREWWREAGVPEGTVLGMDVLQPIIDAALLRSYELLREVLR